MNSTARKTEIERKFLITAVPDFIEDHPFEDIRQGYLAVDGDEEVRIRQKGARFFETIKKGVGLQRIENEIQITKRQFDVLWPLTEGRRIEKRRYYVPYNSQRIEVDVFGGALANFVIAEVEFSSVAESEDFIPPEWFGMEVTNDERYKNKNLALNGLPG